jgi:hypothetical protein
LPGPKEGGPLGRRRDSSESSYIDIKLLFNLPKVGCPLEFSVQPYSKDPNVLF